MCVIEKRQYSYTDGHQRTVEKTRYCHRAVGSRVCNRVEERTVQHARIVERRPSTADGPPAASSTRLDGPSSRRRTSRNVSNGSSNRSSAQQSRPASDRSPVSIPSSASSPPVVEPIASPVLDLPAPPIGERSSMPYPPHLSSRRIVAENGTAIYDRPPSLEMPRATDNERPSSSRPRQPSSDSMTAEVDDSDLPPPPPRRRPSVRIEIPTKPGSNTRPRVDSTRSSTQPTMRPDPVPETPRRTGSRRTANTTLDSDRERRRRREEEDRRRKQEEDERQAILERERIAATERRERHRRAAAEALEGARARVEPRPPTRPEPRPQTRPEPRPQTRPSSSSGPAPSPQEIQARIDAELAQMARERAAAAARQRSSAEYEQLRREAEARRQYYSPTGPRPPFSPSHSPTSTRPPSRRLTDDFGPYATSPITSPRLSARTPSVRSPIVHQYIRQRRRSNSIRERGEEVIAREQARRATEELEAAMSGTRVDVEREVEYVYDDGQGGYVPVLPPEDYYARESERNDRERWRRRGRYI
jgi:hypothetical protein